MVSAYNDVLDVTCKHCGITYQILANRQDVEDWMSGSGYIQDVLAYLSPALATTAGKSCIQRLTTTKNKVY
jgi:hypothetical protein